MSTINEGGETQPMNEIHIAALAYIDTLGGREFTNLEVSEKVYADLKLASKPDTEIWREVLMFGAKFFVLDILGVKGPDDDQLPVELPEGRMFLSFRRDGQYGYDEVTEEDYAYDNLTHVDFSYATDEQKRLHGERLAWIAADLQREADEFQERMAPFLEAAKRRPGLLYGEWRREQGYILVE
jgi:hypothetical protein